MAPKPVEGDEHAGQAENPPYRPGDPPPSDQECAGLPDTGPCGAFTPMESPWERHCRRCGYLHG